MVSHEETVQTDETLDVTEREEEEMESLFQTKVSFKGNYNYQEGALSKTLEDAETDAKEDGDDKKSDDNNDVPGTSLERKKRKRKDRNRTTAKRLKKKKEKEGNHKTDN